MGNKNKKLNENENQDIPENSQIELFATPDGIKAIKSPVRVRILSMLREGDLSFDEIVKFSGRAKSTVSSHLKNMSKEGIISSRVDPDDARKKIFFIQSESMGKLLNNNSRKIFLLISRGTLQVKMILLSSFG